MITPTMPFRFWRNAFSEGQLQEQIERIVRSRVFEHSQTLQRLLQYLSEKSIKSPGEQIKEYTIGVEALNRRQDFDPKEDTIVRVQIYRLRQKLQEYYESEGSQDPIRVTIPKGYYLPAFTSSKEAKKLGDLLEGDEVQPAATKEESSLVAEQAVALPEVEIEENIQAVPVKVSRKIFIYYYGRPWRQPCCCSGWDGQWVAGGVLPQATRRIASPRRTRPGPSGCPLRGAILLPLWSSPTRFTCWTSQMTCFRTPREQLTARGHGRSGTGAKVHIQPEPCFQGGQGLLRERLYGHRRLEGRRGDGELSHPYWPEPDGEIESRPHDRRF